MSALSRRAFIGAAAATLLSAATTTYADEPQTISYGSNWASNIAEAGVLSKNFAKEHDSIGVAIGFKKYEGAPDPDKIGARFKQEFDKLGEDANYFIYPIDKPGYVVSFDHAHSGTEYMSLTNAAKSMKDFVRDKRRFENLLESDSVAEID